MKVIEYFSLPQSDQKVWLERLEALDWPAAKTLADYIRNDKFLERSRGKAALFLLTQEDRIVSLCTLADEDDVACDYGPWIGYVYTDPEYRGHGIGLKHVQSVIDMLRENGVPAVYISSGHKGLYEKLGFTPWKQAKAKKGYETTVFKLEL